MLNKHHNQYENLTENVVVKNLRKEKMQLYRNTLRRTRSTNFKLLWLIVELAYSMEEPDKCRMTILIYKTILTFLEK